MVEIKNSQERPRFLRWKCIDDFPNMNKSKMFYVGHYTPTQSTIDTLTPIFEDIKRRYTKQINDLFSEEKKSLKVSGGNYTFFFILSNIFKLASSKYPFLSIEIALADVRNTQELRNISSDLIFAACYLDVNKSAFEKANTTEYSIHRKHFDDKVFCGTSKEALDEFVDRNKLIKHHNLLFGRLDAEGEKKYLYSVAPRGREHENPKVVVDSHFMVYLLMLQNVGIGDVLSSMRKSDTENLVVFSDTVLTTARRIVFRRKNVKYLHYFSRKLIEMMEENEKSKFRIKSK